MWLPNQNILLWASLTCTVVHAGHQKGRGRLDYRWRNVTSSLIVVSSIPSDSSTASVPSTLYPAQESLSEAPSLAVAATQTFPSSQNRIAVQASTPLAARPFSGSVQPVIGVTAVVVSSSLPSRTSATSQYVFLSASFASGAHQASSTRLTNPSTTSTLFPSVISNDTISVAAPEQITIALETPGLEDVTIALGSSARTTPLPSIPYGMPNGTSGNQSAFVFTVPLGPNLTTTETYYIATNAIVECPTSVSSGQPGCQAAGALNTASALLEASPGVAPSPIFATVGGTSHNQPQIATVVPTAHAESSIASLSVADEHSPSVGSTTTTYHIRSNNELPAHQLTPASQLEEGPPQTVHNWVPISMLPEFQTSSQLATAKNTGPTPVNSLLKLTNTESDTQLPEATDHVQASANIIPSAIIGSNDAGIFFSVSLASVTGEGSANDEPVKTTAAESGPPLPTVIVGSTTYTAKSQSNYDIGSQILAPGSSLTIGDVISKTILALATDGGTTKLIINGNTSGLPSVVNPTSAVSIAGQHTGFASTGSVAAMASALPSIATTESQQATVISESQYVVHGQTLAPNSSITIGSGESTTIVALQTGSGVTRLIIGGSTSVLLKPQPTAPPTLLIDGQSIQPDSQSNYVVQDKTLGIGSTITVGPGVSASAVASQTSDGKTILIMNGETTSVLAPMKTEAPAMLPSIKVDGKTVTADSSSIYISKSQTLRPDAAITLSGTDGPQTISLAPSASFLIVNGATSTVALSTVSQVIATSAPLVIMGGTITADSSSNYVVGSQTLRPGSVITLSRFNVIQTISLAPSASFLVVNGFTSSLPKETQAATAHQPFVLDGQTIKPDSSSNFVIDTQTLAPGSAITLSATDGIQTVSLAPSASFVVVVNGVTSALPKPIQTTPAPGTILLDGQAIAADISSNYIVGTQILKPGEAITLTASNSVQTISLAPSDSFIVINGKTSNIPQFATTVSPALIIGGKTYTANSATEYVLGSGTTLKPSSGIILTGNDGVQTVSLAPSASYVVVNGVTSFFSTMTPASANLVTTTAPPDLTIDGKTFTANSATEYIFEPGVTLKPGNAMMISGTRISLADNETALVVGSSTIRLGPKTTVVTATATTSSLGESKSNNGFATSTRIETTVGGAAAAAPSSSSTTNDARGRIVAIWSLGLIFAFGLLNAIMME